MSKKFEQIKGTINIFGIEISYSIMWVIVAVICVIIEALTLGLATIWFAIGALVGWIFAEIGFPLIAQVLGFLISSSIILYFTRPIAQRVLKIGKTRTNADSLIGEIGLVVDTINPIHGKGQVKISGKIWSAKSYNKQIIERGENVQVLEIQGVKLVVKKVN